MSLEQIHIFHTNDIHSCFENWPRIVSYIKKHRTKDTLYIDLGDHADRSDAMTEGTRGRGNVRLLNEANVDYVTIGNNEGITFSKEELEALYHDANFSVLLANLYHRDGTRPKWVRESTIHVTSGGIKIGLIGLTAPFTFFYEQLGWKIEQPEESLAKLIPDLKKRVDVLILISHLGLLKDEELAASFPEIDLIIGAHSHHVLPNGRRVNETLIVQTGKHGAYLGEVTIDVQIETKRIIKSEAQLIDVSGEPCDEETVRLLETLREEAKRVLDEKVARIPRRLHVDWLEESEGLQFLCDAVTEWCNEKIGMVHAGVLLDSIDEGWVTKGDLHRICPHPINLCVVKVTGAQLASTIERAFTDEIRFLKLKGFGFRGEILGRLIFTGIDVKLKDDETVDEVYVLGKALDYEQKYSVATLDMYTFGYIFPAIAEAEEKNYFMPEFLRDVLAWKIKTLWQR